MKSLKPDFILEILNFLISNPEDREKPEYLGLESESIFFRMWLSSITENIWDPAQKVSPIYFFIENFISLKITNKLSSNYLENAYEEYSPDTLTEKKYKLDHFKINTEMEFRASFPPE